MSITAATSKRPRSKAQSSSRRTAQRKSDWTETELAFIGRLIALGRISSHDLVTALIADGCNDEDASNIPLLATDLYSRFALAFYERTGRSDLSDVELLEYRLLQECPICLRLMKICEECQSRQRNLTPAHDAIIGKLKLFASEITLLLEKELNHRPRRRELSKEQKKRNKAILKVHAESPGLPPEIICDVLRSKRIKTSESTVVRVLKENSHKA